MFKLLVLTALWSAAAAEPGVFYSAPLAPATYAATIAAPAATSTYVHHSSSYVAPTYSDIAYPHFIKKRSPGFYEYLGPDNYEANTNRTARLIQTTGLPIYSRFLAPSLYTASAPLTASYIAPAPITYSSSILPVKIAHFIKKRSTESPIHYSVPEHDVEKRSFALAAPSSSIIYPGYFGSGYFPAAPSTPPYIPTLCSSYYSSQFPGYPSVLNHIKK